MSQLRHYVRACGNPVVVEQAAAILAERWDQTGEFPAPDDERSAGAHARAILGMLSTGYDKAAVSGYLQRAEEAVLEEPRTTPTERLELADAIRYAIVDQTIAYRRAGE